MIYVLRSSQSPAYGRSSLRPCQIEMKGKLYKRHEGSGKKGRQTTGALTPSLHIHGLAQQRRRLAAAGSFTLPSAHAVATYRSLTTEPCYLCPASPCMRQTHCPHDYGGLYAVGGVIASSNSLTKPVPARTSAWCMQLSMVRVATYHSPHLVWQRSGRISRGLTG